MIKSFSAESLIKADRALDHLLLGIADLDQGIEWVREKTGISAVAGGSHPGAGTRNALLSLGKHQYLEIISIDPEQKETSATATLIRNLKSPQLITWAAATADIQSIKQRARTGGYHFEGPDNGARVKPDRSELKWRTLRILNVANVIPFFIEWDPGTIHPSEDSPSGCRLENFEISHPKPTQVREILMRLGIAATVNRDSTAKLSAVLATPKGRIQIS